jgi:TldD protein
MRDLALRALDTARSQGAHYADVRVLRQQAESVTVRLQNVEALTYDESLGFGVRVLVNGYWGFASSHKMTIEEAGRVAGEAVRIAKASATVPGHAADIGPPMSVVDSYETEVQRDPFAVSLDDKIALLLRSTEAMATVPGIVMAEGNIYCQRDEKLFVSTEGSEINQTLVETGCGIEATAVDEGEVQRRSYPNSVGRHQGTEGWEFIERWDLANNAGRVAEEAAALLTAKPCPPGVTTVILDGSQVALQIHESCGHAIELDRVLGTEAAFAGTSFLTTEKLGNFRYGSDAVNLTADATIPGGLGTFGFDDEGVAAQRVPIVTAGRLVGYLTSRETAPIIGRRSMGSSRASGWNVIPLIRMTNVNLLPGTAGALDDLIADTSDGLFVSTNHSWSIDDRRLNFQFGTEIGWLIRNGRLAEMVKNPTYTGITPRFWGSCDAICGPSEWKLWGVPNCGKGEPMQTHGVGHGAAPARFRGVEVGVGHW